jgi:hypothetical protein
MFYHTSYDILADKSDSTLFSIVSLLIFLWSSTSLIEQSFKNVQLLHKKNLTLDIQERIFISLLMWQDS